MDPEKTLTFCLGLKADEMTMSFQGLYGITTTTVAVSMVDTETPTGDVEVGMEHEGSGSQPVVSPKYCPGVNNNPGYLCETGHCCGETGCCTYYYELWWFWLLWTVLILFSCFCAYRHRRAKLRIQQQQRQREINLIAYNGACNYPSSTLDLSFLASFKLPSYEEVAAQPSTPPPPYSSIFALECGAMGDPSPPYHHHHHRPPCPPYLGPGPSGLASSQSSDNYTSCSCESCSITSPSSTSFSVQVTDETFNSSHVSTPSEAGLDCAVLPRLGATFTPTPCTPPPSLVPPDVIPVAAPDVIPVQRRSSNSGEALSPLAPPLLLPLHSRPSHPARLPLSPLMLLSALPPGQVHPFIPSETLGVAAFQTDEAPGRGPAHRLAPSLPKLALFPSNASVLVNCNSKEEQKREREAEEEEEEDDEEDHFRHRRLTGDSGIVVCRCHVKRQEQEKDELHAKGEQRADSADCSLSAKAAAQPPVLGQYLEQRDHFPSSSGVIQNTREAIITMESS